MTIINVFQSHDQNIVVLVEGMFHSIFHCVYHVIVFNFYLRKIVLQEVGGGGGGGGGVVCVGGGEGGGGGGGKYIFFTVSKLYKNLVKWVDRGVVELSGNDNSG